MNGIVSMKWEKKGCLRSLSGMMGTPLHERPRGAQWSSPGDDWEHLLVFWGE